MNLTRAEYEQLLRKPGIARRNSAGSKTQDAKPEPYAFHESVAKNSGKKEDRRRHFVRYEFQVCRLLDWDNAVAGSKWPTDCLRRCGLIRDDCPEAVTIEVYQRKVKTKAEEMTIITIYEL